MTEVKYARRSLQTLSDGLEALGHHACPGTVADLLRDLDYHLFVNVKRFTGPPHPDRDRQFNYLQARVEEFRAQGLPILSVDTKKKELVGNFGNGGRAWGSDAEEVNAHDFLTDAECRCVPYGLYDVLAKHGHVVVGTSSDTPQFAAEATARWWSRIGCHRYRGAAELLLLADAGGSNGCRPRRWKQCLQELLADRYGLAVTVCHYPTGASKWNPVEHRLFGPISLNWAGVPLRSPAVVLGYIRGTTTTGGLEVSAEWWSRKYAKGLAVSNAAMKGLNIEYHDVCPRWNYTIRPRGLQQWN
jgi:Rhodopirellula transposase DDE domain